MAHWQTAFVTGGGSGIGRRLSEMLLAEGTSVAVFDRAGSEDLATDLASRAGGGARCQVFKADVTDPQALHFGEDKQPFALMSRQVRVPSVGSLDEFRLLGREKGQFATAVKQLADARRAPMDCCFSGFKQLFAEGQEFTYGLETIGAYYRDYAHIMQHWHEVLPGRVLRMQYEEVIEDIDLQVRRLLDHCGLEFEAQCLAFYENQRAVRTASSEQVRQPIYTDALLQWQHFEHHLQPLKDVLADELAPGN